MIAYLLCALTGAVIGCCYEGCRRGGTIDLTIEVARLRAALSRTSNVRVLPVQREAGRR